jgi:hypothetical protein
MNVTVDQIENDLITFFNPFAFIAVQEQMSDGGFDVQNVDGNKLRFVIFDKKWEDQDKKEIWEETYDVSGYNSLMEIKSSLAPKIEQSIRIFCGT